MYVHSHLLRRGRFDVLEKGATCCMCLEKMMDRLSRAGHGTADIRASDDNAGT